MKKVLIMVVSSQNEPYEQMWVTSRNTWDKDEVEGVETVFYFSEPVNKNTAKEIYFPLRECYHTMGEKTLMAFEWGLANREFDFIARINASTYVNKKELLKYIQTLPENNVFAGMVVDSNNGTPIWCWGPQWVISKDVVQSLVDNKNDLDKSLMEDVGISYLANKIGVQYTNGKAASIDKTDTGWRCIMYGGGDSFVFNEFEDIKKANGQFFYRVKQDGARWADKLLMENLYNILK